MSEIKTILIIFEGNPSTPAYQPLLDGIRQKLQEEFGDSYVLHIEFLNVENFSTPDFPKDRFNLLNEKYRSINPDLLICYGKIALQILQDNADRYLLSLPTISVDLDYSNYGFPINLSLNDKTVQVGLKFNIEKTILTALEIFPKTSSFYFISGISAFDKRMLAISMEAAEVISDKIKVEVVTNLSMDEILTRVHKIPNNSLILIPVFITDNKLVPYYNPEAINLISREAQVPIIILSDMGIGNGAFGGYVLSFKKVGLYTGQLALELLNGRDPNSIKVTEDDYYEYIFDWRELHRWKLDDSKLIPEGSTILYEETNIVEKYKWIGGIILLFLVLQSILIATLIKLNRNQKLMTKKIIETENKYREFLHEDRSLRLGQIAASLSHELSQPLTAILSTAQAGINFINANEANPELLKQILQKIVDNDKRTASILSSIRGMLKLENREKEKVDLNASIMELVEVYNSEASRQNTKINVKLMDRPTYIIGDKIQIQQVLLNLIYNALQVMENQLEDNRKIDITQKFNNDTVIISVRDYGDGIAENIKENIFKPFVTSRVEGSGIGLSICKSIIEDHKGMIWAENKAEGGAEFSFSLSIVKDE